MSKITFIICMLFTSLGFAQLLEDFEGPTFPTRSAANGAPVPTIVADPGPGGINGDVLEIITTNAGQPWQQANLILQNGNLDLTGTDKLVSVDWYSAAPFDGFIRVDNRTSGTIPAGTAEAAHPGGGWQTLVFDFSNQAQPSQTGTVAPNGVYQEMYFFNLWNIGAGDFNSPAVASTTYIDNIRKGLPPPPDTDWTGATNTDWNTSSNWSNGIPVPNSFVTIPNTANDPIAAGAVSIAGMLIEPGAAATINGAVTSSDVITVSAGASFIAPTSVSGTVTYERNLNSTNWHYISSPVVGQDVDDFVAASGLQTGGSNISFCTFNTAANDWDFYQSGTSNANVLNGGQGYIVNLTAASGGISFTGTMNVGDVSKTLTTTGEGYNLLGNPYTSYIDSAALLSGSSGSLFSETIWVWDQSTDSYTTYVSIENFQLAPGQGFFIQSNGAAGNVAINEAFQNHQGTDTFLRSAGRTEVYLTLSDGSNTKDCKIFYIDGTTTSFDNGYDGPKFRAFPEPFSIYTHLITNGFGRDMGVQSLPINDYENLIVPVGIDATSGTPITISASSEHLPVGINLYLEDRQMNTFTLLNATSDFTLTPATDLNGTGRFYLRTTNSVLSTNENTLAYDLEIYTSDARKELIIQGQLSGSTNANLYDLKGKLVLSKELEQTSNSNALDVSGLSSGLYIVKVDSGLLSKTQKVVIK